MTKLGLIDLEILFLGIKNNGAFNEKDIENSNLKRLGVGRVLDSLASLKDRKLLTLNNDGTFSITDLAKYTLWSEQIPLEIKILRLLEIKPLDIRSISNFLRKPENELTEEIEKLRKKQLVLMSTLRQESKLIKMYEILPEGIEEIKKTEESSYHRNLEEKSLKEIVELINELIEEINDELELNNKKEHIILKLDKIKEKLNLV
ncbi:hypothetical protein YTPLAS73_00340 [Nitrosarchaeum sp.]|nr:hypothetical protein YTPLAS73_00340 [Nitrosarchaeum sp.]